MTEPTPEERIARARARRLANSREQPPIPAPPPSANMGIGDAGEKEASVNIQASYMKRYEYKHIRLDYKGRGITQEINLLDIDGERVKGWYSSNQVPTLPELFAALGRDGWEMMTHVVNQDNSPNSVTFHYYNFRREI